MKLPLKGIEPKRAHASDAGADLFSGSEYKIPGLIEELKGILRSFSTMMLQVYREEIGERELLVNLNWLDEKIEELDQCIQVIGTGTCVGIEENYVGLLWDKSGLASRGITILGGVIDSGYTGEIGAVVLNLGVNWQLRGGDKVCQLLVQPIEYPTFGGKLGMSERGDKGFGSSGK